MAIRLHQMHPALVHLPITLLPLAVGADLLGRMSGDKSLLWFGQKAIGIAAAGAVASAVTGLIAGEEVNVEGESRDMLITHRNLNFAATVVASCMAIWRAKHQTPNALYLAAGGAGVGVVAYTAYLGGKLVYDSGVGVEPPHGVYRADAPALGAGQVSAFLKDRRNGSRAWRATYGPGAGTRAACPDPRGRAREASYPSPAGQGRDGGVSGAVKMWEASAWLNSGARGAPVSGSSMIRLIERTGR